jgi:hypothetical protein
LTRKVDPPRDTLSFFLTFGVTMARVTVEDALPHVDNRFALVLLAS